MDWLHRKIPDSLKLRNIALFSQYFIYALLNLIEIVCFTVFAMPYGWPDKDFINEIPSDVKKLLTIISLIVFTVPVVVSGIFYALLVVSKPNKVVPVNKRSSNPENESIFEENNIFGTYNLNTNSCSQTNFVDEKSTKVDKNVIDKSLQLKSINYTYDYNQILRESGQPFDEKEMEKSKITISFINSNSEKDSSQQSVKHVVENFISKKSALER